MKFSTHVVLFILAANALIGAADVAGMWDDWGIQPTTGITQEQIDNTTEPFEEIQSGNIGAQTLITAFVSAAKSLALAWEIVTALPGFLENIGVPGFIAVIPNVLVVVLVGRDVLQILVGRII